MLLSSHEKKYTSTITWWFFGGKVYFVKNSHHFWGREKASFVTSLVKIFPFDFIIWQLLDYWGPNGVLRTQTKEKNFQKIHNCLDKMSLSVTPQFWVKHKWQWHRAGLKGRPTAVLTVNSQQRRLRACCLFLWDYLHGNRRSSRQQWRRRANSWNSQWRSSTALCCTVSYLWTPKKKNSYLDANKTGQDSRCCITLIIKRFT